VSFLSKLQDLFGGKKKARGKSTMPRIDMDKRFEILGKTGQGSMSQVFRARDKHLGRVVCLKVLNKEKTAKFESRFVGLNRPTEGLVCISLRHKNVVQSFEYGINARGEQCLIMELIDGVGLNFMIETNSQKMKGQRINILLQLTDGLEYIHNQGYLHRDICPRNIMMSNEGVVKYIDFGLAVPNRPEFRRPGNRTGTPNYLAPELIKRVSTDHRVDMFALGVTGYEMFTGDIPWEKSQSLQTLLSHLNSAGKNPREFRPELDDDIVRLLRKAVERDPRDRYQSPAEFREALKALPKQDY
jgi:eukaryotic-like serine/threonine-protein kinase